MKGWRKRWFVLKNNGCLQYYRHKKVSEGGGGGLGRVEHARLGCAVSPSAEDCLVRACAWCRILETALSCDSKDLLLLQRFRGV